ncbi:MAG: radical SAM protein, partial [Clostridia bacterium]|nr:radical SAM protein [Clostridia bacterium]
EKFNALKKLELENNFTNEEIEQLQDMWFVCDEKDEAKFIFEKRQDNISVFNADEVHITVLTTSHCNARCYYCYEHGMHKEHMSLDTAEQVVQYISNNYKNKLVNIHWFGGEPLFNEKIISYICSRFQELCITYRSTMTSNSYLFDKYLDKLDSLWHLDRVQITIDAIGQKYDAIKDYIYKDNNAFEHVINNMEELLKRDIAINARLNFNPIQLQDTIDAVKYIYDRFGNNPKLMVYPGWILSHDVPTFVDFTKENNPYVKLVKVMLNYGYFVQIEDLGIWPTLFGCGAFMDNFLVIGTEGNLYKCEHSVLDGKLDSFGNIYSTEIDESNLKKWKDINYPYDECFNCICLPVCQGGCKYRAMNEEQKYVCLPIKNCVKEIAELFYRKIFKKEELV